MLSCYVIFSNIVREVCCYHLLIVQLYIIGMKQGIWACYHHTRLGALVALTTCYGNHHTFVSNEDHVQFHFPFFEGINISVELGLICWLVGYYLFRKPAFNHLMGHWAPVGGIWLWKNSYGWESKANRESWQLSHKQVKPVVVTNLSQQAGLKLEMWKAWELDAGYFIHWAMQPLLICSTVSYLFQ